MWVNRSGRPYYVSRETWNTRAWLLMRKRPQHASATTRRVAAILLSPPARRYVPQGTLELLEQWVEIYDGINANRATPVAAGE